MVEQIHYGKVSSPKTFNGVNIGEAGVPGSSVELSSGQEITFTVDSFSILFSLSVADGYGCLVHAEYTSATLTELSNPTGAARFNLTDSPAAGVLGIYKQANQSIIHIKNGAGGSSRTINVCVLGATVTAATAPA